MMVDTSAPRYLQILRHLSNEDDRSLECPLAFKFREKFNRNEDDESGGFASMERERKLELMAVEMEFFGGPNLIVPNRRFLGSHPMRTLTPDQRTVPYMMHLFSDVMLLSLKRPCGYKIHRELHLLDMTVYTCKTLPNAISIRTSVGVIPILATNPTEKEILLDAINQACIEMRHTSPILPTEFPLAWQKDTEPKCQMCLVTFSIFSRRHHCRRCGLVVCSSCSPHEAILPRV
eukprot:65625_1